MRRAFAYALLLISCTHATPVPTKAPGAAWSDLGDDLCKAAGASGYDDSLLEIELPRAFFFDEKSASLRPETHEAIAHVARVAVTLPPNVKVLVRSTVEDAAVGEQALSSARAAAIVAELTRAGLATSRIAIEATAVQWEGSYDGPAVLDPSEGQIIFVLTDARGTPLTDATWRRSDLPPL